MKVLFLDFDGVLNYFSEDGFDNHVNMPLWFCEDAMNNLDKIIKNTGTKIVLSTSHRFKQESVDKFMKECRDRGWGDIVIGNTPELCCKWEYDGRTRSFEIRHYLNNASSLLHKVDNASSLLHKVDNASSLLHKVDNASSLLHKVDNRYYIESWAILDDVDIYLDNFIKTDHIVGLTSINADRVINILNREDKPDTTTPMKS
jgi:hypothetical protein